MANWHPSIAPDVARAWAELRSGQYLLWGAGLALPRRRWIQGLLAAGYVEPIANGVRIAKNTGPLPPICRPDGSVYDPNLAGAIELWQLALWRALKIGGVLSTEGLRRSLDGKNLSEVQTYLSALFRAGWIRKIRQGRSIYWQPVKNQPTPPFMIRRYKVVELFDPTTGEVIHEQSQTEQY